MDNEVLSEDLSPKVKERFPRIVIFIILTEFCERFSYSGMRAFLTIYLRSKLHYSDDGATEIYHFFNTFVYFFPIIGGILADNYLGKYRTILYMMFVYAAGNILVAVTAIPHLGIPSRLCTLVGLFMITLGTGGIKPCVTAFGGDQFVLPQQEKYLAIFFSILYFQNSIGSLIAKTLSPILRSEVHCFGDKDCYSLAFGAPGLVIITSVVIFVSARKRYVIKKPEGNVIIDFVKCVALGIKNAVKGRRDNKTHWLDSTQHQYDKGFIRDSKKTLSILMLFTVLPVFWALLDQMMIFPQGSRWTLQATKMDGRFGFVTIKPDQMQVLNPIFCIVLIPLTQKFVYPYLERRNILKNPLHRLTLGGVLAGISFIASGILEIYLKTTYPQLPQVGYSQLRIFNGNPCSLNMNFDGDLANNVIEYYFKRDIPVIGNKNFTNTLYGDCIDPNNESLLLEENVAVSYYVTRHNVVRYIDNVDKSKAGFPVVRFLVSDKVQAANMTLFDERRNAVEAFIREGVSPQIDVFTSTYSIRVGEDIILSDIKMSSGGVYTIMIDKVNGEYVTRFIVITEANSITMALLLPQFFIMAVGEVLFAVTGNEFAFKESPNSMKAVMTAVFLFTEAVGNILIIILTRLFVGYQKETQYFIYTGVMFVSITVFYFMSRGYEFDEPRTEQKRDRRSNSEVLYLQVKQMEECLDH